MNHVFGVVAIVAKFVHHYLVCWEIACLLGVELADSIDCQKKRRFCQLTAVEAVLLVAIRADGEDDIPI